MSISNFANSKARRKISEITPKNPTINTRKCEPCRSHPNIAPALMLLAITAFCIYPGLARGDDSNVISNWFNGWNTTESYLYSSLYTKHYDPDPDHVNDQNMLGFESQAKDKRVLGLAIFDNSFGQRSQYLYTGKKWRQFDSDHWYFKLTAGFIHGYEEPYEDKIPLNNLGVAPVIVPGLGYQNKALSVEFVQLGLSAGLVTVGFTF
jgi:hypothetical protein